MSGVTVGRRELLGLLGAGAAALLTGCGKSGSSPVRAAAASPTASGTSGPLAAPSSAAAQVSSAAPTTAATLPTTHVGGPHVSSGAITVSNAQREATVANGTWRGGWHDTSGASGTSEVTIAINGTARTATGTIAFTGPLLGSGVPAATYDVDLLSFVLLADSWTVNSPQFGTVTVIPGGDVEGSGTAKNVPGHPEIRSISVDATKTGRRVDLAYTVKHTDGTSVRGTMAWSAGGTPAKPRALPAKG